MSSQGYHPQPKPKAKKKAPKPRVKTMSKKRRAMLPTRKSVRIQCYEDDGGRCRGCGRSVLLKTWDITLLAHAHEEPSRAQGGDWCNPQDVITLCPSCHDLVTKKDLRLIKDRTLGTRGPCIFTDIPRKVRWNALTPKRAGKSRA